MESSILSSSIQFAIELSCEGKQDRCTLIKYHPYGAPAEVPCLYRPCSASGAVAVAICKTQPGKPRQNQVPSQDMYLYLTNLIGTLPYTFIVPLLPSPYNLKVLPPSKSVSQRTWSRPLLVTDDISHHNNNSSTLFSPPTYIVIGRKPLPPDKSSSGQLEKLLPLLPVLDSAHPQTCQGRLVPSADNSPGRLNITFVVLFPVLRHLSLALR